MFDDLLRVFKLHGCIGKGAGYYQSTNYASLADTHWFVVVFPQHIMTTTDKMWEPISP
jgi:poly(3-hydroxybutyrate) depolymerase